MPLRPGDFELPHRCLQFTDRILADRIRVLESIESLPYLVRRLRGGRLIFPILGLLIDLKLLPPHLQLLSTFPQHLRREKTLLSNQLFFFFLENFEFRLKLFGNRIP